MAKLSDNTSIILAAAAQHRRLRALPVPKVLRAPPVVIRKALASLLKAGLLEEIRASRGDEIWRGTGHERVTLTITSAGLTAIGIVDESADHRDKRPARARKTGRAVKVAKRSPRAGTADSDGKTSKQEMILAMLRRTRGASVAEMSDAVGWQLHSTRGFLTATIKGRLRLPLISEKEVDGVRRYRIASLRAK